jgi:hypothetical protein
MSKHLICAVCALCLSALASGCDFLPGSGTSLASPPVQPATALPSQPTARPATPPPPTAPPAAETLLPKLPGYITAEGQTLTSYIGKLSGGAALLSGQPELAATLAAVDGIISCYQQVGAVRARLYSNQAMPLSAGTVAIADRKALTDPLNLFRCVAPNLRPKAQSIQIEPCSASYTLPQDGNEFYILYAGTTPDICKAFCTNLQGCK